MNQSEYARHRGVSRQHVSKLVRMGKLILTEDGQIDATAADQAIAENRARLNPRDVDKKPASDAPLPIGGLTKARILNEELRSKLVQLELGEREGELLRRDDVVASIGVCAEAIRRELDQLPLRAEELVGAAIEGKAAGLRAALAKVVHEIETRIYAVMHEYEQAGDKAA
jgi:hypothetical protein